jgi:ankyrin repeat protein
MCDTLTEELFAELLQKARDGKTEKIIAAITRYPDLLNRTDWCNITLLYNACMFNHLALVEKLLDLNAKFIRVKGGWDAIMIASQFGFYNMVKLLLDRGADPNSGNGHFTALGQAAIYNHIEICILLISRGANLMTKLWEDDTALTAYAKYLSVSDEKKEECRQRMRDEFEKVTNLKK